MTPRYHSARNRVGKHLFFCWGVKELAGRCGRSEVRKGRCSIIRKNLPDFNLILTITTG